MGTEGMHVVFIEDTAVATVDMIMTIVSIICEKIPVPILLPVLKSRNSPF